VRPDQAKVILDYVAANEGAAMRDFLRRDLRQLAQQGQSENSGGQGGGQPQVENLSTEQLGLLLDECAIGEPAGSAPGKLNLNTCEARTLEYIPQIDAATADMILLERDSLASGFTSIVELLGVPGMSRRRMAGIYEVLCVRSNVFVVVSRGRDAKTGLEVEMSATIDRSTLPLVIQEMTVR
jgi:hypothetical protein